MNIFETKEYSIKTIPFNYQIDIKLLPREPRNGMGKVWYHPLDWSWNFANPLEATKWVAEQAVRSHFIRI